MPANKQFLMLFIAIIFIFNAAVSSYGAELVGPRNGGLETNGWKLAWTDGIGGPFDSYDVYMGRDYDAVNTATTEQQCTPGSSNLVGDVDNDCAVDGYDLAALGNCWLLDSSCNSRANFYDINSPTIDFNDFSVLAGNWLVSKPFIKNTTSKNYKHSNLKVGQTYLLKAGQTYYWRIDEHLGSSTVKGTVWNFNVIKRWKPTQFLVSLGWSLIFTTTDKPAYAASLKNLGLTTLMDNAIYFDLAANNGLNIALYYNPTTPVYADTYKNNPANWGYWQMDEPEQSTIPYWAEYHLQCHWADPTRPSYTNIQSINYGVSRSYVQYFIDTLNPEILSFDFYQWYWKSKTLIENLEFYRKKSLEYDIPLMSWVEVDTDDWFSNEITEARRRRYSTYMNLVYGVKGIWWFTADRIYNTDGTIKNTTYYNDVQAINVEINNLGPYLVGLTSTAVYHANIGGGVKDWTGTTDPMLPIPPENWVQISNTIPTIPITLGMFSGMPDYECIMITNRDLTNIRTVDITFKDAVNTVYVFDSVTNSWSELTINGSYPNQYVTQSLDQGCGKLLAIVKQ